MLTPEFERANDGDLRVVCTAGINALAWLNEKLRQHAPEPPELLKGFVRLCHVNAVAKLDGAKFTTKTETT